MMLWFDYPVLSNKNDIKLFLIPNPIEIGLISLIINSSILSSTLITAPCIVAPIATASSTLFSYLIVFD